MARTRPKRAEVKFARTLVDHVHWARGCNGGDPCADWPLEQRLAIALVLRNHAYIEKEFSHIPYPVALAYVFVGKGRARPNADLVDWINIIRDAVEGFLSKVER
jgi:hypothetical protein